MNLDKNLLGKWKIDQTKLDDYIQKRDKLRQTMVDDTEKIDEENLQMELKYY